VTRPNRLRRSELSTPGSNERMIAKAAASEADLVFLDLEDSVAATAKATARGMVVAALNDLDWGTKSRAVRINGADTSWCHEDLITVVSGAGAVLDLVIVPKVRGPRDVWFVATMLDQLESKLGLDQGRIGLEILIEETEAVARVDEIASCSPRIEALILGVGDLSASQGVRLIAGKGDHYPGDMWHYARNRLIVAARSNGLDAIDGPNADFRDLDGYRVEARWSATLGAVGKWAIHPSQIAVANEVFSPTAAEIAYARQVTAALQEAGAAGAGAASIDGVMIDAANLRTAEAVLDRAARAGIATGR
jgi:citrate lyase subunit beta/citryl-CoA lyase